MHDWAKHHKTGKLVAQSIGTVLTGGYNSNAVSQLVIRRPTVTLQTVHPLPPLIPLCGDTASLSETRLLDTGAHLRIKRIRENCSANQSTDQMLSPHLGKSNERFSAASFVKLYIGWKLYSPQEILSPIFSFTCPYLNDFFMDLTPDLCVAISRIHPPIHPSAGFPIYLKASYWTNLWRSEKSRGSRCRYWPSLCLLGCVLPEAGSPVGAGRHTHLYWPNSCQGYLRYLGTWPGLPLQLSWLRKISAANHVQIVVSKPKVLQCK